MTQTLTQLTKTCFTAPGQNAATIVDLMRREALVTKCNFAECCCTIQINIDTKSHYHSSQEIDRTHGGAVECYSLKFLHFENRRYQLNIHHKKSCPQIADGYNMTLTDAPNDFGGRLCLNCALTTPELPIAKIVRFGCSIVPGTKHTMWPCDLSPNYSYLRPSYFFVSAIDERHFLP